MHFLLTAHSAGAALCAEVLPGGKVCAVCLHLQWKLAFSLPLSLKLFWCFLGALFAICGWCWRGRSWRWIQNDFGASICVIGEIWILASLWISIFQEPCIDLDASNQFNFGLRHQKSMQSLVPCNHLQPCIITHGLDRLTTTQAKLKSWLST